MTSKPVLPHGFLGCALVVRRADPRTAMQFIAVLRGYGLPVDAQSVPVLRAAADSCPKG
jgi:hypothetical protein